MDSNVDFVADQLVAQLGEDLGLRDWRFDADRVCGFETTDSQSIFLDHPPGSAILFLRAPIGEFAQFQGELAVELLAKQHLGIETGGAFFGLAGQPPDLTLELNFRVSLESIDFLTFSNVIQNFVDQALQWRGVLGESSDQRVAVPELPQGSLRL